MWSRWHYICVDGLGSVTHSTGQNLAKLPSERNYTHTVCIRLELVEVSNVLSYKR